MAKKRDTTVERVRELFWYNPHTGNLIRRTRTSNSVQIGDIAGSIHKATGYVHVMVDNSKYRAHIIIWLWVTGKWPENDIDHEDLDKANNRWINLRDATMSQNLANTGMFKHNTSGHRGVYWYKPFQKWKAQLQVRGKSLFLGYFEADKKHEAIEAWKKAYVENFGEFARVL